MAFDFTAYQEAKLVFDAAEAAFVEAAVAQNSAIEVYEMAQASLDTAAESLSIADEEFEGALLELVETLKGVGVDLEEEPVPEPEPEPAEAVVEM